MRKLTQKIRYCTWHCRLCIGRYSTLEEPVKKHDDTLKAPLRALFCELVSLTCIAVAHCPAVGPCSPGLSGTRPRPAGSVLSSQTDGPSPYRAPRPASPHPDCEDDCTPRLDRCRNSPGEDDPSVLISYSSCIFVL